MESPHNGRAIINDEFNAVEITIPSRKIYFFIIFFCIWIIPFGLGGLVTLITVFASEGAAALPFLIIVPFWAAAITFVGRMLWWMIAGKEIIRIDSKTIEIKKQGLLFSKPKIYDLTECRGFRVMDNNLFNAFPFGARPSMLLANSSNGTIAFDYGMKTIKFADAIDEAEGKHIINLLKNKGFLKDTGF